MRAGFLPSQEQEWEGEGVVRWRDPSAPLRCAQGDMWVEREERVGPRVREGTGRVERQPGARFLGYASLRSE